ncbi:MAG TPA: aldo/keto reductase [Ktedonobacterales bacterium]
MSLPASAYMQFDADQRICRILNGMWQVSGAHGRIESEAAINAMVAYHDAGFTTWDLADHYGPAEDFIGQFRQRLLSQRGADALTNMLAFTKWVPQPGPMTEAVVTEAVDRSLRRMRVERLDMLQFHWWDYDDRRYLDALAHLDALRRAGKIHTLGLTNFDTPRLREILDSGVPIRSNQVQYSLVDQRPGVQLARLCEERGVHLLAYGAVAGGFLSERWVGQREPETRRLETASQQKYKEMIELWGGWPLFQELLITLYAVGQKHGASLSAVAISALMSRPAVAGVIVGARLGVSQHLADTARVFEFSLDADDWERIDTVTRRANDLFALIGDTGDEYRRR